MSFYGTAGAPSVPENIVDAAVVCDLGDGRHFNEF